MDSRFLLYLAALVLVATALVVGLTIPSRECFHSFGPGGSDGCVTVAFVSSVGKPNIQGGIEGISTWYEHRWPLRAAIIGGGLVAALLVTAKAARKRSI